MLFGENKIILTQRSKDGLWIYQEISFTNRHIFDLIKIVPMVVRDAEGCMKDVNDGMSGEDQVEHKKKRM